MSSQDEQRLVSRMAGGDHAAFAALYGQYSSPICRYILTFVKSDELANDLTQEVFSQIWECRAMLGQVQSFRAYLFRLSRNKTLNFLKRACTDTTAKAVIIQHYQPRSDNGTENQLITADYMVYLKKLLQTLPPKSREVFQLCRNEYKTYDEAAAILGISRNAVKKHMVKTMKTLGDTVKRDLGISFSEFILYTSIASATQLLPNPMIFS